MPKLSPRPIDPENMNYFLDDLWSAITTLSSKDQIKFFLKELLTHTEQKMLAKRFQSALMLVAGYNYQTIKKHLKVSEQTIARMANQLSERGQTIAKTAQEIIRIKAHKLEKQRHPKNTITPAI